MRKDNEIFNIDLRISNIYSCPLLLYLLLSFFAFACCSDIFLLASMYFMSDHCFVHHLVCKQSFSCSEPSPVPSNHNNRTQGPYFNLGLDFVEKRTHTIFKHVKSLIIRKYLGEMRFSFFKIYIEIVILNKAQWY